jgi:hypothetical protein
MQHEQQNPISIYYLFCHAILKSISYNLRYAPLVKVSTNIVWPNNKNRVKRDSLLNVT